MSVERNKVMVNVGIPFNLLHWVDSHRGNTSRSNYLGEIILPVIHERMEAENKENYKNGTINN